jgi:hypothetical protein
MAPPVASVIALLQILKSVPRDTLNIRLISVASRIDPQRPRHMTVQDLQRNGSTLFEAKFYDRNDPEAVGEHGLLAWDTIMQWSDGFKSTTKRVFWVSCP